jgi:hypothetical protein
LSVVGQKLSVIGQKLSVVGQKLSAVGQNLSIVGQKYNFNVNTLQAMIMSHMGSDVYLQDCHLILMLSSSMANEIVFEMRVQILFLKDTFHFSKDAQLSYK